MKKNELPPCPVATLLVLIGTKWKVLIVRDLLGGTKRFKELQRSVGCSQKVLTDNLRELENNGLVSRKVYAEVPPRVEYSMTKLGATLEPVLDAMAKWGTEYKKKI
ncbi:MAG: helix-turn-helix transcriptional regulator [Alphaproteobacteria bacterium]|nr:helix-turn-helix transcriptional regulator [Alphaproteobacteria bacterium]